MILIANDDGNKMVERDDAEQYVDEYSRVAGVDLTPIGVGDRPDFVCEKQGRRYGLELVRAMQNPELHGWEFILVRDGYLHGLDAALLVQAGCRRSVYARDRCRFDKLAAEVDK